MENKTIHQQNAAKDEAVKGLYKDLLTSWNQYSAAGFADLFQENGSLVGFDGTPINGREEIYNHLSGIFVQHRPASFVYIIREIRFIAPTVAILRAAVGMVPPGQDDIKPEVNAIQTLVAVDETDQFRIAMFQNTPAAFHGRPEAVEQLTAELREALKGR